MIEDIRQALEEVYDPELYVDIVSLGLIYDIQVKDKNVKVVMTLTFPGCPFGPNLMDQVEQKVLDLGFEACDVELTFEPPWTPEKIDPDVRAALNIG